MYARPSPSLKIGTTKAAVEEIRQHLTPGAPFVMASMYGDTTDPAFDELFALWKAYWLDATDMAEAEVDEMEKAIRGLSFIPEEEIVRLLREAGFGKIAKFFTTNMFGGWICERNNCKDGFAFLRYVCRMQEK